VFATQARAALPGAHLCSALVGSSDGSARADFFTDCCGAASRLRMRAANWKLAIDWGRYGELYDYDTDSGRITADSSGMGATA